MNDDRQMYDNDGQGWDCSNPDCQHGGHIDKLPFEPRSADGLLCFECKKASAPVREQRRDDREMFDNDGQGWPCSDCGGNIDKLPFEPRDTSNLKCRDCFRK